MPSPVTVPRYTIQDVDGSPDDGNRYELRRGRHVEMDPGVVESRSR